MDKPLHFICSFDGFDGALDGGMTSVTLGVKPGLCLDLANAATQPFLNGAYEIGNTG